jgi:membrane associated rhomboid family serine protease
MRSRRSGEVQRWFTFGGRVPAAIGLVLALMLAASVWGWMEHGLQAFAALSPVPIVRGGELWRLVTWPFFQDDPLTLLFGGFMIYWLGQQLAYVWSERRFLLRFLWYTLFASVGTTLLAFLWGPASHPHIGIWPVANALIVSWAMMYPERQVNIWGVLPLTGKALALLVVFGTLLYGIFVGGIRGIGTFSPHLFAILGAWLMSRGRIRSPLRDARAWWAEREQKRRAKHLKVVKRDGSDDRPRWMN